MSERMNIYMRKATLERLKSGPDKGKLGAYVDDQYIGRVGPGEHFQVHRISGQQFGLYAGNVLVATCDASELDGVEEQLDQDPKADAGHVDGAGDQRRLWGLGLIALQ